MYICNPTDGTNHATSPWPRPASYRKPANSLTGKDPMRDMLKSERASSSGDRVQRYHDGKLFARLDRRPPLSTKLLENELGYRQAESHCH